MKVQFMFPKGYKGHCSCGKDAKHTVWLEYKTPIPVPKELDVDFKEWKGIWHNVCDACLKPDDVHKED